MATPAHFTPSLSARTSLRTTFLPPHKKKTLFFLSPALHETRRTTKKTSTETRASNGDSYLNLWKKAVDRERKDVLFQQIAQNSVNGVREEENPENLERKTDEFKKLLEVPKEERDRVQRMQVIDRAAAAIAATRALLKENPTIKPAEAVVADRDHRRSKTDSVEFEFGSNEKLGVGQKENDSVEFGSNGILGVEQEATKNKDAFTPQPGVLGRGTPGPDFWSWIPPMDDDTTPKDTSNLQISGKLAPSPTPTPTNPLMEKERTVDFLSIPFQSFELDPLLPPLQSAVEIAKDEVTDAMLKQTYNEDVSIYYDIDIDAAQAAKALHEATASSSQGVQPDGSKYWKESGIEQRADGVVCRWTLIRGVSEDGDVEWEEKFWEAAGQFDYKELGSEKSGRDARGNVWREYWKESMWQDQSSGLIHMEKNADKWGKNGYGGEWHEKWYEHYDASGKADKWADKWCSIDPNTPLNAGHAHVWHERWGETYDGHGSSTKYTDKWAERLEGDEWTKWGDKWDENFNQHSHGVKQGEKWWQGKHGEQWNRTWGEQHNGSGWIHKYGKSSCGEHWDTHVRQDTWYERYPHFGFEHCFENSVQLREVRPPTEAP